MAARPPADADNKDNCFIINFVGTLWLNAVRCTWLSVHYNNHLVKKGGGATTLYDPPGSAPELTECVKLGKVCRVHSGQEASQHYTANHINRFSHWPNKQVYDLSLCAVLGISICGVIS